MTYAKLHDTFLSHPKVTLLESGPCFAEAIALWTMSVSWCSAQLSDGIVPRHMIRKLVPFEWQNAASELVRVRLWRVKGDDFAFHDWSSHQKSAHRIAGEKSANATRQRVSRDRKRASRVTLSESNALLPDGVTSAISKGDKGEKGERVSESATRTPTLVETHEPDQTRAGAVADRFAAQFAPKTGTSADDVARWFSARRESAGFGRWHWTRKTYGPDFDALSKIVAALAGEPDPEATFDAACRGFFADEGCKARRFPISFLAHDFGSFAAADQVARLPTADATSRTKDEVEARLRAAVARAQALAGQEGVREARAIAEGIRGELRALNANLGAN